MKRGHDRDVLPQGPSLPTRERGLKHIVALRLFLGGVVAPYAGAWIETKLVAEIENPYGVAPYAGAWIETIVRLKFNP